MAFLGWLPLVVAVAPLPTAADIVFVGASLAGASSYPLNVILLAVALLLAALSAMLLAAFGEAALLRSLAALIVPRRAVRSSPANDTGLVFAAMLVASLPVAAALLATATAAVVAGITEYQSPDIAGNPVLVRILADIAPYLAGLAIVLLLAQAYGAAVIRRLVGATAPSFAVALVAALGDLLRAPLRILVVAVSTLLVFASLLVAATLILRLLWLPIGEALARGRLFSAEPLLLLVGFVAIWLCLVLAQGAAHAWASAWWTLELRALHAHHAGRPASSGGGSIERG